MMLGGPSTWMANGTRYRRYRRTYVPGVVELGSVVVSNTTANYQLKMPQLRRRQPWVQRTRKRWHTGGVRVADNIVTTLAGVAFGAHCRQVEKEPRFRGQKWGKGPVLWPLGWALQGSNLRTSRM